MENLFAVISSLTSSCKTSIISNSQLSNAFLNNTVTQSSEITCDNLVVSLVKYTKASKSSSFPTPSQVPIICNADIDNKALINILDENFAHHNQAPVNNEQLLLEAYKNLGSACFSHIKGEFQTILWDATSNRLCAALAPFSGQSLFYLKLGSTVYIASDSKLLADISGTSLTLNKTAISQWLSGRPSPNISMFNEIQKLPAGHCLEYDNGAIKLTKFWDISPNNTIRYSNNSDYQDHFFALLENSVAHKLHSAVMGGSTVFCQMSGGMDSTSVTAIAKQLSDQNNIPLHTLSHRYQNTQSCDESTNINDMIQMLDLKHQHYVDLDKFQSSAFSELYPTDFDSPGIVLSPKYHQELSLMKTLGTSVLLTGNGGDEVCWGHSDTYRSRLYKGELSVINEVINTCKQLDEPVLRSLYKLFMPTNIQNLVKLARNKPLNTDSCPPWLTQQAKHYITDEANAFINPFSATFSPAKHARYQGLQTTSTYNSMRSYQKVANLYGIDVKHPFFDTDIVEFSFAIPEKLLIQGAYPKWLLRKTMNNYLPKSVCWNKHKVVFDHHFANLIRSNKHELRQLLSHEGLQDLGLLDNKVLLQAFDAVVENPDGFLNVDMLYAILTQLWFQTHYV